MSQQDDHPKDAESEQNEERAPGERVYAPASERVAKPPAPGHETLVKQVDETTPERRGATEPESTPLASEDTDQDR
jgi:hypothetical protein